MTRLLPIVLVLASCGRARPPATTASDATPPAPAEPAPAADDGEADAPTPELVASFLREPWEGPALLDHMDDHADAVRSARAALLVGYLPGVKEELAWLAGHDAHPDLDPAIATFAKGMSDAAAAGADATTPGTVGQAFAQTTAWCGRCHAATGVKPTFTFEPAPVAQDVRSHMARHTWAVDRLWEGVVGPDDHSWKLGAQMLLEQHLAPEEVPHDQVARDPALDVMGRFVHDVGESALDATTLDQRAELMGQALATCADCHLESGILGR